MWIIIAIVICGMVFNGLLLTILLFRREKSRNITLNIPNMPERPYPPYDPDNDDHASVSLLLSAVRQ